MQKVHFLVSDSHRTGTIANNIREYFGDKVLCYEDEVPPDMKIDVFVFSGTKVINSPGMVKSRKDQDGSEGCIVIASSTVDEFLNDTKRHLELGIDYAIPKGDLIVGLVFPGLKGKGKVHKVLDEVLALFA